VGNETLNTEERLKVEVKVKVKVIYCVKGTWVFIFFFSGLEPISVYKG